MAPNCSYNSTNATLITLDTRYTDTIKVNGKGKVLPITVHEGPEDE